jgi:rRNA processing protein Gar1
MRPVGFVLICVMGLACAENDATGAVATDSVSVVSDVKTGPDGVTQVTGNALNPFDVFGVSGNDVAATVRETPLWLVNQSTQALIVTARGGAAGVVVDTVGPADSTYVKISTRALTLELSARTSDEVPMGVVTVPMDSKTRRAAFPQ